MILIPPIYHLPIARPLTSICHCHCKALGVLQSEDEFTKIVNLIPGGPADMDGRLKPADRILGVAQGLKPFEDVVGWRLDEVIQPYTGPKGSQVRLEVQAGDDAHRENYIHRDRVQLEEQSAKVISSRVGKIRRKNWCYLFQHSILTLLLNKPVIRTTEAQPETLKNYLKNSNSRM